MESLLVSVALTLLLPVLVLWPLEWLLPAYRQPLWRSDTHLDVLYLLCMPALRGALVGLMHATGTYDDGIARVSFQPGRQPGTVIVIEWPNQECVHEPLPKSLPVHGEGLQSAHSPSLHAQGQKSL